MNIDIEKFIKEYEQKEKEILKSQSERERKNPMCLNCSRYFPGCCACESICEY